MGNILGEYNVALLASQNGEKEKLEYANYQIAIKVDEHQHSIRVLSLLVSWLIGITLAKEWVPQNTFWADLLAGALIGLAIYWAVWYFTEGS